MAGEQLADFLDQRIFLDRELRLGLLLEIFGAVFDAGKRRALIRERRDEVSQAEENLQRVKDEIEVRINMIYNRLEVARAMVDVRKEYLAARQENARLSEDQFKQGLMLASQRDASQAQAMKARSGLLDASLAYLLARDDLDRALGGPTP